MKILTVIGARPQFIKAATVSRVIADHVGMRETWGLPAVITLFTFIIPGARHVRWGLPPSQVGLLSLLISSRVAT